MAIRNCAGHHRWMTAWLWIKVGTAMVGALALASVAGSSTMIEHREAGGAAVPSPSAGPNVIDFSGLRGIQFGGSMRVMKGTGIVSTSEPGCGPTFTGIREASPVFEGDRLVLIWAHAPLRTPEGVTVGTSLEDVRRAYPSAIQLARTCCYTTRASCRS